MIEEYKEIENYTLNMPKAKAKTLSSKDHQLKLQSLVGEITNEMGVKLVENQLGNVEFLKKVVVI